MRLIFAVVQDKDVARLLERLMKANIRATKLNSSGGFLRAGNTTLMIGVEDERLEETLTVIKQSCKAREQLATPLSPLGNQMESYVPYPVSVQVGGATVFVVSVDQFEQF